MKINIKSYVKKFHFILESTRIPIGSKIERQKCNDTVGISTQTALNEMRIVNVAGPTTFVLRCRDVLPL